MKWKSCLNIIEIIYARIIIMSNIYIFKVKYLYNHRLRRLEYDKRKLVFKREYFMMVNRMENGIMKMLMLYIYLKVVVER